MQVTCFNCGSTLEVEDQMVANIGENLVPVTCEKCNYNMNLEFRHR